MSTKNWSRFHCWRKNYYSRCWMEVHLFRNCLRLLKILDPALMNITQSFYCYFQYHFSQLLIYTENRKFLWHDVWIIENHNYVTSIINYKTWIIIYHYYKDWLIQLILSKHWVGKKWVVFLCVHMILIRPTLKPRCLNRFQQLGYRCIHLDTVDNTISRNIL